MAKNVFILTRFQLLTLLPMSNFTISSTIIVTCHKRVSNILAQEISDLGFEILETFPTGVRIEGTLQDCIKLNLNLRCASQVLFLLDYFEANDAQDIYENALSITWETLIPKGKILSVTSNVQNDSINNNLFANLRVKDAIVDRLRDKWGDRPTTGPELTGTVVHLYWKDDEASLFLDTSGESLGRHGYRKIPGKAPMLESLAAATILSSKWDRNSTFINPMCGSGTLAIEAALIAKNMPPGLFRENYAFMHIIGYDESYYQDELKRIQSNIRKKLPFKIIASDWSRFAIANARANAAAAGVEDDISFETGDFANTHVPSQPGVIFINPEYGERLGDLTELEETYSRMGDFFKHKCPGYIGYIFTGNMELAKKIGLKTKRRIEFYNSKIDCRLLEYELYQGSKKLKNNP